MNDIDINRNGPLTVTELRAIQVTSLGPRERAACVLFCRHQRIHLVADVMDIPAENVRSLLGHACRKLGIQDIAGILEYRVALNASRS